MTATVVNAFPSLGQWQRQVSRMFDGLAQPNTMEWTPRADVAESEQGLSIQFDLPGVRREDLEIQVEQSALTVRGERKLSASPESFHRVERPYGPFVRVFALPDFVDTNGIQAKLADGVLALSLPRREESKPKQIAIEVAA